MVDLHWMGKVCQFLSEKRDVEFSPGKVGREAVAANFHEKQGRWPGLRTPMGDPGEPMDLLHQLQYIYSGGHNARTCKVVTAVHVPE